MSAIFTGEYYEKHGQVKKIYLFNCLICDTDKMPLEKRRNVCKSHVVCDACKQEIVAMKKDFPHDSYFDRVKRKLAASGRPVQSRIVNGRYKRDHNFAPTYFTQEVNDYLSMTKRFLVMSFK